MLKATRKKNTAASTVKSPYYLVIIWHYASQCLDLILNMHQDSQIRFHIFTEGIENSN